MSEVGTVATTQKSNQKLPTAPAPAVELKKVRYAYRNETNRPFEVLKGIDLRIEPGEIYGVLGPNGAGKSTTFRILAGLAKPTTGAVLLDGHPIASETRDIYHKVGYMPDLTEVFDNSTLSGLLRFFGRCQKMPEERIEQRIDQLLKRFGLVPQRNAYLSTLSKGMKQQAHLMRCLLHEPNLLILDEPASHLDPLRREMLLEILREERARGTTIVISSHILPELSDLCTSLAIMRDGVVVEQGRVEELKRNHQHRFATYRLRLVSSLTVAQDVFARLGDNKIRGLTPRPPDQLVLEYEETGGGEQTANLIQLLVLAGVRIVEFSRLYKDIEEIYKETIRGWGEAL
jgi:ABC-2 type transport system ATP-binding protein